MFVKFFYHWEIMGWTSGFPEITEKSSVHRFEMNCSFYIQHFKPLPSFCGCTGRFESYLVKNPKDRFCCDVAQIFLFAFQNFTSDFSSVAADDIFYGDEREALLNQIICEHFLRQGKLDIAESLSEVWSIFFT